MTRSIFESLGLFAAPFVLYALFLIYRARHPLVVEHWSRSALSWLTLAGLLLAIGGFLVAGFSSGRSGGVYVPASIDDHGRLIPGHFQTGQFQ
jgi:heme A synthase